MFGNDLGKDVRVHGRLFNHTAPGHTAQVTAHRPNN